MSARSGSPKAPINSDTKRDLLERFIPLFSDYPTSHYKELPGSATWNIGVRGITMCLDKSRKSHPEEPRAVKPRRRAKITVRRGPRPHLRNRPASGPRGRSEWEWGRWAASHRPTRCVLAQACTRPALRARTEPEVSNRDVSSAMDMGPHTSEARSWSDTTLLRCGRQISVGRTRQQSSLEMSLGVASHRGITSGWLISYQGNRERDTPFTTPARTIASCSLGKYEAGLSCERGVGEAGTGPEESVQTAVEQPWPVAWPYRG